MPSLGPRADRSWSANELESQARENRKQRVLSLLAEGLPVPQGRIFDLLLLLAQPVLDLNGITEIVRTEPLLNTHVEGLLRSYSSEENPAKKASVSEFLILLGSDRLRILALGCALAEFAGKRLPAEIMRDFWRHSILTALLSSRIAREAHPESVERAYLAGLLHDVGKLPLLVAAHEHQAVVEDLLPAPHQEPGEERAYFGLDHTEVGRWMALSGNLPAWMIDVLTHHHDQASATEDPTLVAIVATADRCSHLPAADGLAIGDVTWEVAASQPFGMN
ncbi:MAG TPA: HDOD domain-containing protein [Candidatus Acidoferrales bacterium]|jgi:putative nucleotidyltransferase with HDIG domain|nr:HDOD domain-containing protein [Candidatus Acidoferrales bacterium]